MQKLDRRNFLGVLGGSLGAAAVSFPTGEAFAAVKSFIAFGDSYTVSSRFGIPSWATQINSSGAARQIVNLARSGATVTGTNTLQTFDGQVDVWIRNHKARGLPDRTVVYLGYNNILDPMTTVQSQYRQQIDRLIANGVTQGQRRLVLCLLHDWSRNPGCTSQSCRTDVRPWVLAWNRSIRSVAGARPNCVVVDLFTRFEDVFRNPGKYGLTNVTTPNRELSASTHLYADSAHFGQKGQQIIASMIRPKLV